MISGQPYHHPFEGSHLQFRNQALWLAEFQSKLLPKSFLVVVVLLAWLSLTGVIWPLWVLAGISNTPPVYILVNQPLLTKAMMLIVFAIGLLGFVRGTQCNEDHNWNDGHQGSGPSSTIHGYLLEFAT